MSFKFFYNPHVKRIEVTRDFDLKFETFASPCGFENLK